MVQHWHIAERDATLSLDLATNLSLHSQHSLEPQMRLHRLLRSKYPPTLVAATYKAQKAVSAVLDLNGAIAARNGDTAGQLEIIVTSRTSARVGLENATARLHRWNPLPLH